MEINYPLRFWKYLSIEETTKKYKKTKQSKVKHLSKKKKKFGAVNWCASSQL
jgi:hypothetical protein